MEIEAGKWYLYRKLGGQVFHVRVLRVGRRYALCRWRADVAGLFGVHEIEKVGWKLISRILPDD